jgi:hypothetical protein
MPTKKDVSDWPVDLRLSTFNALSDRISQDLYDRYPESQGYCHERPTLFRESAYLSRSYKVTRANNWGLEAILKLGILDALGQEMALVVSPAIPYKEARFTRSLLTAIPVAIGSSIWILMNMRKWSSIGGAGGLVLTALAGMVIFGITLGLAHAVQGWFSNSAEGTSTTLTQDIKDVDDAFDLSAMVSPY